MSDTFIQMFCTAGVVACLILFIEGAVSQIRPMARGVVSVVIGLLLLFAGGVLTAALIIGGYTLSVTVAETNVWMRSIDARLTNVEVHIYNQRLSTHSPDRTGP